MTLLLDAGALIAFDRGQANIRVRIRVAEQAGEGMLTTTGVVAQVCRGGAKQANIARLLKGTKEIELTKMQARRIGTLLAAAGTADVIDGSIVDIAHDGDEILTSDPDDMEHLAMAAGKTLIITPV